MNKAKIFSTFFLCFSLLWPNLLVSGQKRQVRVEFKETTLKNGLRVITVEDKSAPVVSVVVTYDVGSRDDRQGRTGVAHLFEHMMFEGSENVGRREHTVLVSNYGGFPIGSTGRDRTWYYNTLSANQLDMVLFLEADRMRSLNLTRENLDNQLEVVKEERRLQLTRPYRRSIEAVFETLYDSYAYKHLGFGTMQDMDATTVESLKEFFSFYYTPNNAVLTVVGDFKTDEALFKIKKYFESIPRKPAAPLVDITEPEQRAERRATIEDPAARLPRLDVAYKVVPGNHQDLYPLTILSLILQTGQSSRLYQKLVKEKEMANDLSGDVSEMRGPGMFITGVVFRPEQKPEAIEAVIATEIERLKREPVADWEMQKARGLARRDFINSIRDSVSRATLLGSYAALFKDPNLINKRLDGIDAVTKEDVQRVANKYLRPTNRTIVLTMPKQEKAQTATGQKQEAAK